MSAPTRLPNGVTNSTKTSALGNFGLLDPTKWHSWVDDFNGYDASEWVITTVEAGAGAATEAIQDEDGGVLLLTNDDADNDSDSLQWSGVGGSAAAEIFLLETNKKLFFKSRVKISDATQSDMIIGLQIGDTAPFAVTDGVFFSKADGAATLDFIVEKDSTATTESAIHTMVDDTYVELAYFYNGNDAIEVFVNDAKVASVAVTNLPDDEELTISFAIQNGEAAAKTMSIDYVMASKER